ncbi:uncharacterized protein [Trachinotus anak]|uniref:uncharacterized protein isoform X2 n=1 Tax=Trachinotus anak TaxID=443729 RepID=UPI0039F1DB7D
MNTHRHTQTHTLHTAGLVYFNVKSEKVGASDHEDGLQSAGSRPGDQLTLSIRLKEPNTADESEDVRGSMMLLFLHSTALIWTFSFSIPAVSCLVIIKGFIGDNILLPCVYPGIYPPPQMVNVYWRDKDNNVMLDIISGVQNMKSQSNNFSGRVISSSDQYWKGNFSIVLQNVQESDTGVYECNIPAVDLEDRVQLNVTGKRVAAENAAVTLNASLLALLSVLLTLLSYTQIHS